MRRRRGGKRWSRERLSARERARAREMARDKNTHFIRGGEEGCVINEEGYSTSEGEEDEREE